MVVCCEAARSEEGGEEGGEDEPTAAAAAPKATATASAGAAPPVSLELATQNLTLLATAGKVFLPALFNVMSVTPKEHRVVVRLAIHALASVVPKPIINEAFKNVLGKLLAVTQVSSSCPSQHSTAAATATAQGTINTGHALPSHAQICRAREIHHTHFLLFCSLLSSSLAFIT
jgi:hypothetical protein